MFGVEASNRFDTVGADSPCYLTDRTIKPDRNKTVVGYGLTLAQKILSHHSVDVLLSTDEGILLKHPNRGDVVARIICARHVQLDVVIQFHLGLRSARLPWNGLDDL